MVSQTLSNASSTTSNNKISRRKNIIHPKSNRRSMHNYQTDSQSSLSQNHFKNKHPTPCPARPQYNVNKQFKTRNRSFDSSNATQQQNESQQSVNDLDSSQVDQSKHETQDPNYQELVRNFHTQNRKENQMMNESYHEKSSQNSILNNKQNSSHDLSSTDKPKRIIISDLMQYTQNRSFNPKKNDMKTAVDSEKFENEDCGATKKTAKYFNTAL